MLIKKLSKLSTGKRVVLARAWIKKALKLDSDDPHLTDIYNKLYNKRQCRK